MLTLRGLVHAETGIEIFTVGICTLSVTLITVRCALVNLNVKPYSKTAQEQCLVVTRSHRSHATIIMK